MKSGFFNIISYNDNFLLPGIVIHIADFQLIEKLIKGGSIVNAEDLYRIEYLKVMSLEELKAATQFYKQSGFKISSEEARLISLCKNRNIPFMLTEQSLKELCFQEGVKCLEVRNFEINGK